MAIQADNWETGGERRTLGLIVLLVALVRLPLLLLAVGIGGAYGAAYPPSRGAPPTTTSPSTSTSCARPASSIPPSGRAATGATRPSPPC